MGKTTMTLDPGYFTEEVTSLFVKDFEKACQSMELDDFNELFIRYDLSFMQDFREVHDLVADIMTSWKKPNEETEIQELREDSAKCLFCNFGRSVRVFTWKYRHTKSRFPLNMVIYKSEVGFYLSYKNNRLIEFGVCNAYT